MLLWKGVDLKTKGIIVEKTPQISKGKKRIDTYEIAGRSGFLTIDNGTYDAFVVSVECHFDNDISNWDVIKAYLDGYGTLSFDGEREYTAIIQNAIPFDKIKNFKKFVIQFLVNPIAEDIEYTTETLDNGERVLTGTSIQTTKVALKKLKLYKESAQSSTPTPTNPQIISTITNSIDIVRNSQTYTISLGDNEIVGLENNMDELLVENDGKVYLNKKVGKLVLQGTENIVAQNWNNTDFQFRIGISDAKHSAKSSSDVTKVKCNYLKNVRYSYYLEDMDTNSISEYYNDSNVIYYIKVPKSLINNPSSESTAVQNFKSWLTSLYENDNPMILYYYLKTSQLIDLETTINFTLVSGTNNISNSEDATMDLIYSVPTTYTINGGTTNIYPILEITGTGDVSISVNNKTFYLLNISGKYILDCKNKVITHNQVNAADHMKYDFPVFKSGDNTIQIMGTVSLIKIKYKKAYL